MSENRKVPIQTFELCKLEIGIVQDTIARFDSNGLQVKTWCATAWIALQAFSLKEELPRLAAAGLLVAMVFAVIEISYRRFQWRFIKRSRDIEQLLSDDQLDLYEYSLHRSAIQMDMPAELMYSLRQAHFYLLYVLLALLSIAIWWLL